MNASPSSAPGGVERLRAIAAKRLGLRFDDGKSVFLCEVLQRRIEQSGRRLDDYLLRLEATEPPDDELRVLAQELTVAETYFFRGVEQLQAFMDVALPACALARPGQPLRVLSAGCASGEEPYSLAILLSEQGKPWTVELHGIDVNSAMLKRAEQGRYSAWALRETPAEVQARCFRPQGRDFVLHERFRSLVTFEERNLIRDDPAFWRPGAFDVIFCRNVLMYFSADVAAEVVSRFAHSLAPGGYLFLGYAETLRGLSQDFHLLHTHDTFYSRHRQEGERGAPGFTQVAPSAWAARELPAVTFTQPPSGSDAAAPLSWVETIRQAAQRVESLTQDAPPTATETSSPLRRTWDLGVAVELMRQEKFGEALAVVKALPPESSNDADVLLLRAVLLPHGGDLAAAEALCADVLRLDELSAGAHYLMALCREGAGDRPGAAEQDRTATYLDPLFAMPRLHLGLLARKSGDQQTARHELREAHQLLQAEDPSRLLLFGGGFTREALIAFCRAELAASGGTP